MVWITRTDKPLSDPTGLSSKEAVSTVLNTRVIPAWSPSTQKIFCKNFKSLIGGRMEITDVLLVIGGLAIAGSLYLQYRNRKK